MTPAEARSLLLFVDSLSTVIKFTKQKIEEARQSGLISVEEQAERINRIDALLAGVED
jgi:hypothetical protein